MLAALKQSGRAKDICESGMASGGPVAKRNSSWYVLAICAGLLWVGPGIMSASLSATLSRQHHEGISCRGSRSVTIAVASARTEPAVPSKTTCWRLQLA